ncbi:ABC transporter permease [Frankia sp. CNm7]|uniref:Transport permease protein n=1 Tax=Frankia nepalensis TaxID=1836974 RepID=A0A937REG4_9ACTN|nr:ABC transporter permease [Frankia nepalensis]MBL7496502.1 ABC transporter permease [Frankia nepalensis]MBL7511355.1 ABC transporter permease [Frankia nepalensis]MBL7521141.1 ABC transporter permease [Frankia nepalensis]MBL7627475.1 ABC transporter permease [Frankia nepalensis]
MTTTTTPAASDLLKPEPAPVPADLVGERLSAVLASRTRPPKPSALSACGTFGWRALLKIKHVPEQLFDVTAFPVMMTLMFTYLFGGALADSPKDYLQFFLPGTLVSTIAMITMYTGLGLNNDIKKGVFDRIKALPVWRPAALVGMMLGDVVRYSGAGLLVIALGLALGFRPDGGAIGVVLAMLVLLLFSFSLAWVWNIFGMVLRTPESVLGVSMMVLFPLTFGSNIYVDPSTMPGWLQAFVDVNPISHVVTAVRGLMHDTVTAGQLGWVFLWCAILNVIFAPITMRLYNRR